MRIYQINEPHYISSLSKEDFLHAESLAHGNWTTIGEVFRFKTISAFSDIESVNIDDIKNIFSKPESVYNDYRDLPNIFKRISSLGDDWYPITTLDEVITDYINLYLKYILDTSIEIESGLEDIEELITYLEDNKIENREYGLSKIYEVIVDLLDNNYKNVDIIKETIETNKCKSDDGKEIRVFPIVIHNVVGMVRTDSNNENRFGIKKLFSDYYNKIVTQQDIDIFSIINDIYLKSEPFRRLGCIELITTDSIANIKYKPKYIYATENGFRIVK